jgi:hypothetical protein
VYLAHKGNVRANWFVICQQFDSFCECISGLLIGSFAAMAIFIVLISLTPSPPPRSPGFTDGHDSRRQGSVVDSTLRAHRRVFLVWLLSWLL